MPPADALARTPEFRRLVARRWAVALGLTGLLLAGYFGFVLLLAFRPDLLARPLGPGLTVGIPAGLGVIAFAWGLTAVYARWATRHFDPAAAALRRRLRG